MKDKEDSDKLKDSIRSDNENKKLQSESSKLKEEIEKVRVLLSKEDDNKFRIKELET